MALLKWPQGTVVGIRTWDHRQKLNVSEGQLCDLQAEPTEALGASFLAPPSDPRVQLAFPLPAVPAAVPT